MTEYLLQLAIYGLAVFVVAIGYDKWQHRNDPEQTDLDFEKGKRYGKDHWGSNTAPIPRQQAN